MNARRYRLIYSEVQGEYIPVPEVTLSHICVIPGVSGSRAFPLQSGVLARILGGLVVGSLAFSPGHAQTVISPDGRTQTTVTPSGSTTAVTTGTIRGTNAFNSFSTFNVGSGDTVNLYLPGATQNLINIVRDEQTNINGILNAIKDGRIGGNVWFANPFGFVVGQNGIVNVGSLTVATPTPSFVQNFFLDPDASAAQLLAGTAPRNGTGLISIQGQVNAVDGIALSAGVINVGGSLYSGARFTGSAPDFTDVVNANGLVSATNVIEKEGRIQIVADGDVNISGTIATPGGAGVRGGEISIQAGNDVDIDAGANLSARGNGANSSGGTINVWGANDATFRAGALIDASAGTSGNGGAIEFSAKNTVELAGGVFRADGMGGGQAGSILIDPANILVSANILRSSSGYGPLPDGASASSADLTLQADDSIIVDENITISTRSVAGTTAAAHASDASTGDSGNLTLEASSIELKTGSHLLADAADGHTGGVITLTATSTSGGDAKISLSNATLKGASVTLGASSSYDSSSLIPIVAEAAGASIDIQSSHIEATAGNVAMTATSTFEATPKTISPAEVVVAISSATVNVDGASTLQASGNATLKATSTVKSTVTPGLPSIALFPLDAGVAVNTVVTDVSVHVGGTTAVTVGGALEMHAKNTVTATTTADASASGATAVAGTVAVTEATTSTQAYVDGDATITAGSIAVKAESENTLSTTAKAAAKGAAEQPKDAGKPLSKTEQILAKFKSQASTPQGGVDVAAAVAVANVNNTTQAYLASSQQLTASGALVLSSQALNSSKVVADGSSTVSSVGIGAAVGLNIGVLDNQAVIADNSKVQAKGITVSAISPDTKTNTFDTTATSGAGASTVGVAGSLGVNVLVNTTEAYLEGDADKNGSFSAVNADGGAVLITAKDASASKVTVNALEKAADAKSPAAVGVGASVGLNVAVNTTRAEVEDGAALSNAQGLELDADGNHTLTTSVKGGASGAKVSVTPVAAVTVGVNTTTARLGTGAALTLTGPYKSLAKQVSSVTSTATGQTQGDNVAVGASLALNTAVDTVSASLERDVTTTGSGNGIAVEASSSAKSSASATASVTGGHKEDAATGKPNTGDATQDKTADDQVKDQGAAAKKVAAAPPAPDKGTAPTTTPSAKSTSLKSAASTGATGKLNKAGTGDSTPPPATSTEGGGVSVAAAIGVNVGVSQSTAAIGAGRTVTSSGALTVGSVAQADAASTASGTEVDANKTNVGVGAAVALNAGIAKNQALIGSGSHVTAQGVTVSAAMLPITSTTTEKNDFSATAKAGAGAKEVGVAGSLAVNVVVNTTEALIEGTGTDVDAGNGDVLVKADNDSTSAVTSGETVATGGKVGIGASIGVNVAVDSTRAEVKDGAALHYAKGVSLEAEATHTLTTTVTGGNAGSKVAITPVAAVAVAVNSTAARMGTSTTALDLSGALSVKATETDTVTTSAKAQATGDVAVGASLAAAVVLDHVSADLDRNVASSTQIDLEATSTTSMATTATAGAKGAKAQKTPPDPSKPDGTTVDEQKDNQLTSAADRTSETKNVGVAGKTKTATATTPETNKDEKGSPKESGKKVSVAAAIGVGVAENQATATTGTNVVLHSGGNFGIQATTHTNYATQASGEAVSDNVGIAAAVALTATMNKTQATLGADSSFLSTSTGTAPNVTIAATSYQNQDDDFPMRQAAEAMSGASGGDVAVAGALAVVANDNETRASIDEGATVGQTGKSVGDVSVTSDDTSKLGAVAAAGALGKGTDSKAGVGASFAVLLSNNHTTAAVGYGILGTTSNLFANSLNVQATRHHIPYLTLQDLFAAVKKGNVIGLVNPATYLSQVNYYTEAVAGAATKGDAAVSGAFSVNVFGNTTEAYVNKANVTTSGAKNGVGVQVASQVEADAIAVAGAVAAAKKAGVGISNTDIVNLDKTLASIGAGSTVISNGSGADVKVDANANQNFVNVSVSGAGGKAGVAGVLGVVVSLNTAQASIGSSATVQSMGDVAVDATNDSLMVMVAGGVAGGTDAGVGGAIAANIVSNKTLASIDSGAKVDAADALTVNADANETAVTAVVAGAGGGKAGVAAALSLDTILTDTEATVGEGAQLNVSNSGTNRSVTIGATDDTVIVGVSGGLAGGGQAGVGAAMDAAVLIKTVKAGVADDTDGLNVADIRADKNVSVNAASTEDIVSTTLGLAGGGDVGVGGAVSIGVVKNDVQATIGKSASVDSDGNVLVNAQDDITAVLTAGGGAGGGTAGVGGSLAVATLLGSTKASVADNAKVNARGNQAEADVYTGETVFSDTKTKPTTLGQKITEKAKGLSITAYNRENLITTVIGGAGGGTAGVAATVSANVIASKTEASIGQSASINGNNTGANENQQVRVKAVDETLLINSAGAGAGGGTAGVGAAANVGVIAKTTTAKIGKSALVNAKKAVELDAASSEISVSTTIGLAGGGSAGVGGAVGAVGVANTTQAYIEDVTTTDGADDVARALKAAKVNVTGGDLALNANDFASTWLISAGGGGGGAAGVGGALSVGVNASTTKAKIGDYAQTNASGTTAVHADSTENANSATIAGAGGGAAGVSGAISLDVVVSKTEAGIGKNAAVNQAATYAAAGQTVDVKATDRIITVGAGGAGAGGGAAGVGGTADVTVALNTTSAYIDNNAKVDAVKDVKVDASSEKYVNSVTFAGAGGGAAGVAGAVSVISVGSLLDGEAKSGLSPKDEDGKASTTQGQADGQTTKSAVGYKDESGESKSMLGESDQAKDTTGVLNSYASKLAVSDHVGRTAPIEFKNTQAFIGKNAEVKAGENVTVTARDKTLAIVAAGAGAGGGAAGVAGSLGVVLLHDSAEAFIADGAKVDAGKVVTVAAETGENVFNVGITGSGAGAADVSGSIAVNVVSSDTAAYIGAAQINQKNTSADQSVAVTADSASNIVTVAANGGGAGAASVGGVLNVNTLLKTTKAYIGEGAVVAADKNVDISADSSQNIIAGGIAIHGAGAAAVSGVVAVNVIDNTTEAFIGSDQDDATKSAPVVDSNGNVTLSAVDDSLVVAVSAAGNGAGAAGVGVNVGANVISNKTRAYIAKDSTVNAWGNANGTEVYTGAIDNTTPTAIPEVEGVGNGSISNERKQAIPGNVKGGASFNISAGGGSSTTVDPTKGPNGTAIPGASGGVGTKGKQTVKGLSVVAMGNEKMITATVGIAGAGAAAVTGAATANVISTVTEATIGDGAQINQSGATCTDPSVRVGAADNTFMVQVGGTFTGAGAAAVSGTVNTGIVTKTTTASIGDADVEANNVEVAAKSSENLYTVTANVAIAGAAGVGAAVGVDVVTNATTASIGAGANIDATGDIRVKAKQDTAIDLYTVAGAGGIAGVSGALSVGVIDNTTKAYVEGAALPAAAVTLNAGGTTEIKADSKEDITSVTVSAAGGGVGVAGAIGVKVVKSETAATIGENTKVNQARDGVAQDVIVSAADTVKLSGGGGSGAVGAFAGVGATADIDIVRNTTTATIGNSTKVNADRDVSVTASSTKDVQSAAIAAAGGGSLGIGGAASVVSIGAELDADSQGSLQGSSDGKSGDTASFADGKIKQDNATEVKEGNATEVKDVKVSAQLGNSKHVQKAKEASSGTSSLGIAADLNTESTDSLDKTQASIGNSSAVTAGHDVKVSATDTMKVNINAVGAGVGFVGIGGAVGVGVVNSTTEAFVDASAQIDADADGNADGDVTVEAKAKNVDDTGSKVMSTAGAGGIVGASAAVAVMNDTSTTKAYLGDSAAVQQAATLTVSANTARTASAESIGASEGVLAIGASVASASFAGKTSAYLGNNVQIGMEDGKTVGNVLITATDGSTALAKATAGTVGIFSGSGAVATATVKSEVNAAMGDDSDVVAHGNVTVSATATPQTEATALGVNIGYGGAVGASIATADSSAKVHASLGKRTAITAAKLDVLATQSLALLMKDGVPVLQDGFPVILPSALAKATGASGGLLLGANATLAMAENNGETGALVGANSTLKVGGATTVQADSASRQTSSGLGFSGGFVSVGADYSRANSDSLTEATLEDGVKVSGGSLQVVASSKDSNYAFGLAGSGGVLSAPFSAATTSNTSRTYARTGGGDNTAGNARKIDVGSLLISASHGANFDSWINNTNASLIGVSGANATNTVSSQAEAHIGTSGYVEADNIKMEAHNDVTKGGPASGRIAELSLDVPEWNVDSNSGGLVDVPAADSSTTIGTQALVQVGAGAHLEQTGSRNTPGVYNLDAWNDIQAKDQVRMASGGLVSAASGRSAILAEADPQSKKVNSAAVNVGIGAEMTSVGDMALGARSVANLSTQAAVDIYGAVGVAPFGESSSRFQTIDTVAIGADATLESLHDIRLSAGSNTSNAANSLQATAHSDVFNNTAIPVNRDPVADAIITTHSQVTVGSGADISAVRHVILAADEGSALATGVGIGKDIYREALAAVASAISEAFGGDEVSFETRTGRSIKNQTSDVEVQASAEVHVGTQREQKLVIGLDGTITSQTGDIHITDTGLIDIAADILKRIDDLNQLITDFSVSNPNTDAAIAVEAYKSEIRFLQQKLAELGAQDPTQGVGLVKISPLKAAQESVTAMTATETSCSTTRKTLADDKAARESTNHALGVANDGLTSANQTLKDITIPDLEAQIAKLDPESTDYDTNLKSLRQQITNCNNTIDANNLTIGNNNGTIGANNIVIGTDGVQIGVLDSRIKNLSTQIGQLQAGIDANNFSDIATAGPKAQVVTISDAVAQLGNIYVRGDRLHGKGTLDAPGDAKITITNTGPSFMILKNLTIPPDAGGKVYFNNVDVQTNDQINGVNGATGAAFSLTTAETGSKPQILVESKFDPLLWDLNDKSGPFYNSSIPVLAPDIIMQGDLSNLRGLVKVDSAAGNIRLEQKRDASGHILPSGETATVRADSVQIETRSGDFTQSYTNSFVHVAGDPLTIIPGQPNLDFPGNVESIQRNTQDSKNGIVANGSVLIAARYLNINGNVQSGIPEWGVTIPVGAEVTIGSGKGSFTAAQNHYNSLTPAQRAVAGTEYYEVSGATVTGLGVAQTKWEQIPVRYNAKENRLELSGVQVQGGYIELYGQIFNTNSQGGNLSVLDGYGQVKIDNQTSLALWVNPLDTGRGVTGKINITNITGIDSTGHPVITTTSYTRNGGARTGYTYTPTAGLRYANSVGYDEGQVDFYRMSHDGWFNIPATFSQEELDTYRIDSKIVTPNRSYSGAFLGALPGLTDTYPDRRQTEMLSSYRVDGRSWTDRHWWSLWTYATYYREFTIHSTSKVVYTDSLKADNPIAIRYIGFDQGKVDVTSTGNVVVNGSINNRNGNTAITSSAGSIAQNGDLPIIGGNNIALIAGTGIGTPSQELLVNVKNGGKLDAASTSGDIRIGQVVGDLRIGTIGGAGVSNVVLEADRDLLNWDASSYVQGHRVELVSNNAGIGAANDPLIVRTGYSNVTTEWPDLGLKATARDSINLKNVADPANSTLYSGNLLLVSADSAAGDVRIETTGQVIDNNPYETKDERTEEELANLWDSLRLRGDPADAKADEAVASFESGKSNNYQLYWQLRKNQPDQGAIYDPTFTLSQAERVGLAKSGMTPTEIDTFATSRSAQYQQLHAEVGGLTSTYSTGFHYHASDLEKAQIHEGSSWSDAQLKLSVGAGLLKNITDTVTTIQEPNAKGRNVTLIAGTGVGSFNDPLPINLKNLDVLTQEQKAALAAAERGDANLNPDGTITITRPRPVNVTVGTGALVATTVSGDVFIGSEQDLRIDRITTTGDLRIKTAGSLINAAATPGAANITGHDLILEAANGGIGSLPDEHGAVSTPLIIDLEDGAGVIARAANDIWIEALGDLSPDTMFSRGDLRLDAYGSIFDFHLTESPVTPYNNLLARNLWLTAETGSIGTWDNALDVGVNPDGRITAAAHTFVFLNAPAGESFNIGGLTAGDAISLSSATAMKIYGTVSTPGSISLASGGTTSLLPGADVHSTTLGVTLSANALTMSDGARLRSDLGTLHIDTVGDAVITGLETGNATADAIAITSTAGHILDGGDKRLDIIADKPLYAQLTISGALGIGDGNPLEVQLRNLDAQSGGLVALAEQDSLNIVNLTADALWLSAPISLTASTPLHIGSNLELFSDRIDLDVKGRSGVVGGSITGFNGGIASNIRLGLSSPSGFAFTNFRAAYADVNQPLGWLSIENLQIQDRATFTNPFTRLLVDQHVRTVQPYDVQLYSGGVPFAFKLRDNLVDTTAYVVYRSPMHEVIAPAGKDSSSAEQTEDALTRSMAGQFGSKRKKGNGFESDNADVALITLQGVPVSLEGE